MNNKELFYFVGSCLTLDENPRFRDKIIYLCENKLIDWRTFVSICSDHLILQAIYIKFETHKILKYLPEELSEHLSEVNKLNISRNKNIISQIKELVRILNINKTYPIFLKGSGNLLDGLYANSSERIMGDIDFLVPEKDYLLTARTLEKAGYSKINNTPSYSDIKSLKHYPRMSHPDFESVIEIHRIPVDKKYTEWFNSKIINLKKKKVENLPGGFVLSDPHKIIHNFIHSQLTNGGHLFGIISFKELYDLYLLSNRYPIGKTLPMLRQKRKAIAYFAFARSILNLDESFYPKRNFTYWILLKKHSLNLRSVLFYKTYRGIVFIGQRIFQAYVGQLLKAFYSKEKREFLARRIGSSDWYKDHIRSYTHFFKKEQ